MVLSNPNAYHVRTTISRPQPESGALVLYYATVPELTFELTIELRRWEREREFNSFIE